MSILAEFPTCPQCFQMLLETWELIFGDEDIARVVCENCGAVYSSKRVTSDSYQNELLEPGVK